MSSPGLSIFGILGVLVLLLGGGALLFVLIRASRSEHGFTKAQKIAGALFGVFALVAITVFVMAIQGQSEPEDPTILVKCPGAEVYSGEVFVGKGGFELPVEAQHMRLFPGTPNSNEVTEDFFPGFQVNSISSHGLSKQGAKSLRYGMTVTAVSGSHPDGTRDSFLLVLSKIRGDTLLGAAIPDIPTAVWLLRLQKEDLRELGDVKIQARGNEGTEWFQRWLGAVEAPSFEIEVELLSAREGKTYFSDRFAGNPSSPVESAEENR